MPSARPAADHRAAGAGRRGRGLCRRGAIPRPGTRAADVARATCRRPAVPACRLVRRTKRFRLGDIMRTDVARRNRALPAPSAIRAGHCTVTRATFQRVTGRSRSRLAAPGVLVVPARSADAGRADRQRQPRRSSPPCSTKGRRGQNIDIQFSALLPQANVTRPRGLPHRQTRRVAASAPRAADHRQHLGPPYQGGAEHSAVRQARQQAQQARQVVSRKPAARPCRTRARPGNSCARRRRRCSA